MRLSMRKTLSLFALLAALQAVAADDPNFVYQVEPPLLGKRYLAWLSGRPAPQGWTPRAEDLAYKENVKNWVLIGNNSKAVWKFGIADDKDSELKDGKAFGTVKADFVGPMFADNTGEYLVFDGDEYIRYTLTEKDKKLEPGHYRVQLDPKQTIVLKPERNKKFARVFYLRDKNDKIIYFTLTYDGTATGTPKVGIAPSCYSMLNDKPVQLGHDKYNDLNILITRKDALP